MATAWTRSEVERLVSLHASGADVRTMSLRMGRSMEAIRAAVARFITAQKDRRKAPPPVRISLAGYPRETVVWAVRNRDRNPEAAMIAAVVAEANRRAA